MEKRKEENMDFEKRVWSAIDIMKEEYDFTPTVLIKMINDHGAVEAVKRLINNLKPSSGYTKLWELKALNLSMEAIILEEEWKAIFSEDERKKAKKRLSEYGYKT
jgi:hypothetical protein